MFVARIMTFGKRVYSNKSSGRNIHLESVQDDVQQTQQADINDVEDKLGLGL